jgi:arylsulfatase A-like enzyme
VLIAAGGCGSRLPERPSIVVIVVDDLGAFDLTSYGHPYHRTPNIDRLAREGLRFSQAYAAAPVCAPSRAAFFTGKSPARLHLTHSLPPLRAPLAAEPAGDTGPAVQKVTEPRSATWLPEGEVTIAERLRARGYRTALIGKWHLGREASGPANQGFDLAIGGEDEAAPASFFDPYGLERLADRQPGEYLTDRLTDEALAFLDDSAGEPFFLVLSHFAVHTPIEAPPDRVREWEERLPAPSDSAREREPEGSLRAAYAAMLESVDHSVGRVTAKLEELGIARDTLVVLTSDNGAVGQTPDTGQIVSTNAPLRGGKATLYEGGLRVPLLVRWPAVVAAGRETDLQATTADWFPTLLDLAGAGDDGGGGQERLDGVSLAPLLRDGGWRIDRSIHFHYPHYIAGYRPDPARETWWNTPGAAVRSGALKLIRRFDGGAELYDLATDPSEARDVAADRPDDARRLETDLDDWLETQGADLPRPNLAYDAGAFAREIEQSVAALGASSEWTPNGECTKRVAGGKLALDCAETPFIVGPEMVISGPVGVAVRFKSTGTRGAPALWYRAADKPAFSGDRVSLQAVGDRPDEYEGRVGRDGSIRQLRMDFGRGKGGKVEVDWIRVLPATSGKALVEWNFDDAAE